MRHPHIRLFTLLILLSVLPAFAQHEQSVYVTVEGSKTLLIKDLSASNFRVFEDGSERKVTSLDVSPEPMDVAIVFDGSGTAARSLTGLNDTDEVRTAIGEFVQKLPAGSQFFFVGFTRQSAVVSEWSSDPQMASDTVDRFKKAHDRTYKAAKLYDVYLESIRLLNAGKNRKKVLIAFTDGEDSGSSAGQKDVIQAVQQSSSLLYSVTLTDGRFGLIDEPASLVFLSNLARVSGGQHNLVYSQSKASAGYFPLDMKPGSEVRRTLDRLGDELSGHYRLRFASTPRKPGETSEIKIKVELSPEQRKGKGEIYVRYRARPSA